MVEVPSAERRGESGSTGPGRQPEAQQASVVHTAAAKAPEAQQASVARVPTAKGARTCLWGPEARRLYLAVPARAGQAAEIRVYAVVP